MRKPKPFNRRSFLTGAGAAIGATALSRTALSYGRILGANDRISLGHIGVGRRDGVDCRFDRRRHHALVE